MTGSKERFEKVLTAIDEINRQDPNVEIINGEKVPKEWIYGQRMTDMLNIYEPDADETLRIAAHGQHIKRWEIPRESYPMDRKGYLKWRTELKFLHANLLSGIMTNHGYDDDSISTVKALVTKKKLKSDPDTQALEDVICLVFLKHYYEDFMIKHDDEKVISILQKTWGKMTDKGHKMALELAFNEKGGELIGKALQS